MKCNNCGANFQTEELRCPYCGSENIIGEEWERERASSKSLYERMKAEFYNHGIVCTINKLLNKTLIILTIAFIVLLFINIMPGIFEAGTLSLKKTLFKDQIMGQMEEYHTSGEWDKLERYMSEYDMFGEENYVYCQAAIMERDYQEYMCSFMQYIELSEEDKDRYDYYLERAIDSSRDLYRVDCGIYDELQSENWNKHKEYQEGVMRFWKASLGLTDEEIQFLIEEDYLYMEDEERYVAIIKERKAWE